MPEPRVTDTGALPGLGWRWRRRRTVRVTRDTLTPLRWTHRLPTTVAVRLSTSDPGGDGPASAVLDVIGEPSSRIAVALGDTVTVGAGRWRVARVTTSSVVLVAVD